MTIRQKEALARALAREDVLAEMVKRVTSHRDELIANSERMAKLLLQERRDLLARIRRIDILLDLTVGELRSGSPTAYTRR